MSDTREPIGYLPCKECLSLKSVFQGQGKRARFLYVKCDCGIDQRTGAVVQSKWAQHVSKEEAAAALEAMKQPEPKETDEPKPKSKAPWIVAGVLGAVSLLALRG